VAEESFKALKIKRQMLRTQLQTLKEEFDQALNIYRNCEDDLGKNMP